MCDVMNQGVLVKPLQDFHDLKVMTLGLHFDLYMTDEIDLSFFLF